MKYARYASRYLGTRVWERFHNKLKPDDYGVVTKDISHSHRAWLMEQFENLPPFSSVLEVGCGFGLNLQLLYKKFRNVNIMGIDINPLAVFDANKKLSRMGLTNPIIFQGKAHDLSQFSDSMFDVVFTDAVLWCIGPDKIRNVLGEMNRISRKALLFIELHSAELRNKYDYLGEYTIDGWIRDYRRLLHSCLSYDSITITKIPIDIWPTGRWPEYGHLITVLK